jgi:hypothetical protein
MNLFPLGLESPGPRLRSTRLDRTPARLLAIIAEHHHRGFYRYTPRDVTGDGKSETWCNVFAQDVAEAMGAPLPRHMRANELLPWLAGSPEWKAANAVDAMQAADRGELALGCWQNPKGPGHVAVLVPSLGDQGVWLAQAGASNFTRGTLAQGFGVLPVSFFTHP